MGTKISLKQLGTDIKTLLYYGNSVAGDTPVGEIIAFMGNAAPPNYLICDGAEYNISDYPHLANHIRDSFGTVDFFGGDGQDTFSVPDLRGEFLRGSGENSHINNITNATEGSGGNVGEHQSATIHPMTGTYGSGNDGWVGGYGGIGGISGAVSRNEDSSSGNSIGIFLGQGENTTSEYKGLPTVHTSRPTNTSVLWCIKCKPSEIGHTYSYEERRVGNWVDGKPLYEKTVNFGALPNATAKEVPHGIENADVIWIHDGYILNHANNERYALNRPNPNNNSFSAITLISGNSIRVETAVNYSQTTAVAILRYTKTIDQPLI